MIILNKYDSLFTFCHFIFTVSPHTVSENLCHGFLARLKWGRELKKSCQTIHGNEKIYIYMFTLWALLHCLGMLAHVSHTWFLIPQRVLQNEEKPRKAWLGQCETAAWRCNSHLPTGLKQVFVMLVRLMPSKIKVFILTMADGSCYVFLQMAKIAISSFPEVPQTFDVESSNKSMKRFRRNIAEDIMKGSGDHGDNNIDSLY